MEDTLSGYGLDYQAIDMADLQFIVDYEELPGQPKRSLQGAR